jgi:hypothetical protein
VNEYLIPGSHLDLMYYELTSGGHGIWPAVYAFPAMYDWMFSHTTAVPEPSSLAALVMGAAFSAAFGRRRGRCSLTGRI